MKKSRFGLSSSSSSGMGMSSSISSISSMAARPTMNLKSFTKKVSAGLNMSHLPNLTGDPDKKAKQEAEQRKANINEVLLTLEDVHLQCPPSHSGLILAFAGTTLSPIMNPGIKFTWFRMTPEREDGSGGGGIEQVLESLDAWYAPTVDDVGCMICAQVEDNYEQGYSRYYECGPLKVDGLLCSMAESMVDNGSFESQGICVSLGLEEEHASVDSLFAAALDPHAGGEPLQSPTGGGLDTNSEHGSAGGSSSHGIADLPFVHHQHNAAVSASAAVAYGDTASALPTVLSKSTAFVQLDGRSTVEVDSQGVFISIPTFENKPPPPTSAQQQKRSSIGQIGNMFRRNSGASKDVMLAEATSATALAGRGKGGKQQQQLRTSRRGLRIPASPLLRVSCAQPLSVVLTVPITSATSPPQQESSSAVEGSAANSDATEQDGDGKQTEAEAEKMRRFLASSTVAIPWTYEGHNHSPEAYAASAGSVDGMGGRQGAAEAEEERARLLRESERDSLIFASTVSCLAEFISALPEGATEVRICFACSDRLVRDALALSMRALACQPAAATRPERMRVFPWLGLSDGCGGSGTTAGSDEEGDAQSEMSSESEADGDEGRRGRRWRARGPAGRGSARDVLVAAVSAGEADGDARRQLRLREEENAALKRERNELTDQLLEAREQLLTWRVTAGTKTAAAAATGVGNESSDVSVGHDDGGGAEGEGADHVGAMAVKQLSGKVIELENKISIAAKKEVELTRVRDEVEARNLRLQQELDRAQRAADEGERKLSSLQSLYDRQLKSIELLEEDQERTNRLLTQYADKLREMEGLRESLRERDAQIKDLREKLSVASADAANYRGRIEQLEGQLEEARLQAVAVKEAHAADLLQREKQLSEAVLESKRLERDVEALQQAVEEQQTQIAHAHKLKVQLREARDEIDKLAGELNSLQRKSDSQGRDLKKVMRDNAAALSEFEKALVRKSEECNDLYYQLHELQQAAVARAGDDSSAASKMMAAFSHMSRPRLASLSGLSGLSGLGGIGGTGSAASSSHNDSSSAASGTGSIADRGVTDRGVGDEEDYASPAKEQQQRQAQADSSSRFAV